MSGNALTRVTRALAELTQLEELDLSSNALSERGVDEAALAALPKSIKMLDISSKQAIRDYIFLYI